MEIIIDNNFINGLHELYFFQYITKFYGYIRKYYSAYEYSEYMFFIESILDYNQCINYCINNNFQNNTSNLGDYYSWFSKISDIFETFDFETFIFYLNTDIIIKCNLCNIFIKPKKCYHNLDSIILDKKNNKIISYNICFSCFSDNLLFINYDQEIEQKYIKLSKELDSRLINLYS